MRVDDLLDEIEPLTYKRRCERLAQLRRLAGDPALAGLLDGLGARGNYERSLALFIAAAVRDDASLGYIGRTTQDPDAQLACEAIRYGVKYGVGPEPLLERLEDAPAAVRAVIYDAVRKRRRTDLADALIGPVADRFGDQEAVALLPACGDTVVRARLDALAHAVASWKRLGHAHPGPILDHAERRLAELPEGARNAWWNRHGDGIAAAVPHDPGRVVTLLERHCHTPGLPYALQRRAGLLLAAEPDRMLRLLLSERHRGHLRYLLGRRALRDRLARLDDTDLAAVARAVREDENALSGLLVAFAPSRRGRLFDAAMSGVDLSEAELGDALLDVLPRAVRIREARRMLGLRHVAETPARVRELTAHLPYDEALPVLGELTRRPDADERATGYRLLIHCAGRTGDPDVLTRMFESLGRLRNEQDPVRGTALRALVAVPENLLLPLHAAAVGQLTDDALDARDCSHATRHTISQIATVLCRQGAIRDDGELVVFGLDLFTRLTGHAGMFTLGRLDHVLRRGQEHRLAATLAPYLRDAARRDDHRLALILARSLGRRAYDLAPIQDALRAALEATSDFVLRRAIELWLAPPRTRDERVAVVVERDPSTVAIPAVLAAIALGRTDLLHLVLSRNTPAGRFQRADVTYVPIAARSWVRRWTGRQRDAYLALLERAAASPGVPDSQRAAAVSAIANVPGTTATRLRPYFASEGYIRRVALTAAAWTASPQDVLPDLLAHASSDDAHVAVYAASRAARFVPPSALAGELGPVLTEGKITARKEALRILLRNRVPEAMDLVTAAWEDPGQHRDVRAAIVSAVRDHLAEPAVRRILTEAAEGPRDLARQVLGVLPLQIDERFRTEYAALVVRVARSADPEARDAALTAIPAWAPWAPDAPAVLAALITDLGETRSWRAALSALVGCVAEGAGAAELGAVAAELAAAPDLPDAAADRDLPALQRLTALVGVVRGTAAHDRRSADRAVRAVDGRLPEPLAGELTAATLRWDSPCAAEAVDALADRCTGGPLAILHVAGALADGPIEGRHPQAVFARHDLPEPDQVYPHAARLAARGDLAGGLFACALAERHGPRAGWPQAWRDLLRGLRAHTAPDVAFVAKTIHTAQE
ncbi:hypothetical protein [Actinoallomurus sp. CA-150999]|uniref:hypothetical protein n=1 Tax=Actinoallomurus sp. CA-150999 TaxID=3239887 RepID=UPI003D8EDD26